MWVYCTFEPQEYDNIGFSRKNSINRKIYFFIFYPSPNVAPTPTDRSCSNSIFRVVLQLFPAHPFHFWPTLNIKGTLMLRVVHIRNKKRNEKHGILQRWSIIVFVAMLSPASTFHFRSSLNIKGTLMLRVVHIRNKKRNENHGILQTWSIVFVAVIKLAGETDKKVLLSVIWNLLLIEIKSLSN